METLSVVIITRNEEQNLPDCLAGASWADEIVVMDSGSSDRTLDVARESGAKIFQRTWDGYTGQRNAAHDRAAGDWILSLDADERITPELADEIRAMLADPDPVVAGYHLPYKVYYRGRWLKHGGFYPETHLRLFRRGRGAYGDRAVHEAIRVDGPTKSMSGHVEHHSYRSIADYLDRMAVYAALSAREYARQGRTIGPWGIFGRAGFTFVNMYLIRLGFLDGYPGFLMAGLYTMYTFTKYAVLHEINEGL
jgi:glycosyltransferase involved in cell wall biosynthesis